MFNKKPKRYGIFLKQIGNTYEIEAKEYLVFKDDKIIYKKKLIPYSFIPTPIKKKNKLFWLIDIDKGFIDIKSNDLTIDMNLLNEFVSKHIFINFKNSVMKPNNMNKFIDYLVGILIGSGFGLFIGSVFI